jgi:hypothetical protein
MPSNPSPQRKRGFRVVLSLDYDRRCACGAVLDYANTYDAEFCRACDRWWASQCSDPHCEFFCAKRPARPSLAPDLDPAERIPFNPPKIKKAKPRLARRS